MLNYLIDHLSHIRKCKKGAQQYNENTNVFEIVR
jgi:hypothetical protein